MRRSIALGLVAATLLFGGAACGNDASEDAGGNSAAPSTTATSGEGSSATTAKSSGGSGEAALEDYCKLTKEAASVMTGGAKRPELAAELQDAYTRAMAAIQTDPQLGKKFTECAKAMATAGN